MTAPRSDSALLEFIKEYYFADDLEEAHKLLTDIAYSDPDDVEEAALYENCLADGEYKMTDTLRECAVSIYEDISYDDDFGDFDHHGDE